MALSVLRPKLDVKIDVPFLVLIGEEDNWTPASLCRGLQANEELKKAAPVEMVFYPGAYHGFDRTQRVTEVSGWSVGSGVKEHKIGGNPKAAEDSLRTKEYFARMLDKSGQ
jgi:dienelactone hydrolase